MPRPRETCVLCSPTTRYRYPHRTEDVRDNYDIIERVSPLLPLRSSSFPYHRLPSLRLNQYAIPKTLLYHPLLILPPNFACALPYSTTHFAIGPISKVSTSTSNFPNTPPKCQRQKNRSPALAIRALPPCTPPFRQSCFLGFFQG